MDPPIFKHEPAWDPPLGEELHHVPTRSESPGSGGAQQRHSSVASSSTRSATDSIDSGSRGRRTRPSITSSATQLAAVQERNERRLHPSLSSQTTEQAGSSTRIGSDERVVSSKKVLTSFSKVASRNVEKEAARKKALDQYKEENQYQRKVLKRLVKWADTEKDGLASYFHRRSPAPDIEELKDLARHYYTPRSQLQCHVMDYGEGRAEHKVVDLGQLEEYWVVKPDWVDVRWIHAPLGLGLMHSSVEDIFLHEGETGREFEGAGRSGWPYLETEVLNFRHRDNFQEMRDVWTLLHQRTELGEALNESTWKGDQNASLHHDVDWRADHLAMEPTFWNLVDSDMPWQLSEGVALGSQGPKDGLRPVVRHVDRQTLAQHSLYRNAQLVRNPFRTFHRGDGFLLTLSPMAGVNYLDKNFSRHLSEPTDAMFENDDASAIGHVFQAFAENGTNTWHRRTTEWLLVYILTEVGTTPHNFRQGCNFPSFETAYQSIINDLKRRRYEKWEPKKTIDLVRDYLNCIDEVTTIKLITHKTLDLFKVLQHDIKKFEAEDIRKGLIPDNADGESSLDRLSWAIKMTSGQAQTFDRLLGDLRASMDALFQLRSIEQNELAIISDSQNKAIFVFTGVTIVFLPLSFFTSYYGMNLQGIVNSTRSEHYFWRLCGSIALAIVVVVVLWAYRHGLKRTLRARLRKPAAAMV